MSALELILLLILTFALSCTGYWAGIHDTLIRDPEHYQEICAHMWPFPKYKCEELE